MTAATRPSLVAAAFRLEWLTLGWLVIEAAVGLGSGIVAGSLLLIAFGLDSLIELASAGVLIWRLGIELRRGAAFPERIEHLASRIAGGLLFALAAYVAIEAGLRLWHGHGGDTFSAPGFAVATLSIPVMFLLGRRKLSLASGLGSAALRADAAESLTCFWLSLVVVIGQAADVVVGAWWIDPVAALGVLWFVLHEAREAWEGEACCDDGCG